MWASPSFGLKNFGRIKKNFGFREVAYRERSRTINF